MWGFRCLEFRSFWGLGLEGLWFRDFRILRVSVVLWFVAEAAGACGIGFRVQGSGLTVKGLGFSWVGLGFRV